MTAITQRQDGKSTGRHSFYLDGVLRVQGELLEGASAADDPFPSLAAYATTHGRFFYPDGRLMGLILRKNYNGIMALWRGDGSLLMTRQKASVIRGKRIFWDANGNRIRKGTPAAEIAAQEAQALVDQTEDIMKAYKRQIVCLDK